MDAVRYCIGNVSKPNGFTSLRYYATLVENSVTLVHAYYHAVICLQNDSMQQDLVSKGDQHLLAEPYVTVDSTNHYDVADYAVFMVAIWDSSHCSTVYGEICHLAVSSVEHSEHPKVSYFLDDVWYDYVNGEVISNVASFILLEERVKRVSLGNYPKPNAPLAYYEAFFINSYHYRFNLVVESEPSKPT